MNRLLIILLIAFIEMNFANAQTNWRKHKIQVPPPICYASGKVEKSFIPPPFDIRLKSVSEKKSEITVEYSLFPEDAKQAFEYAVTIWEGIIESDIPIYIQANWRTQDANVLGSAGPSNYYSNFENTPHKNRFYPVSIVEKITRVEIAGSSYPDITATFNKDIDWYFGTDGETPDLLYDFVTVVLHEIAHGLGFTGFFFISGDLGVYGNEEVGEAAAFDLLVVKNKGEALVDTSIFQNQSTELNDALVSGALYANSSVAIVNNNSYKPRLYVPATWDDGSSIYHLNDDTYPSSTANSLMTHAFGSGEAIHDPGPITKGIMADIGWKHMYLDLDKPKDIEVVKPIIFNVSIKSDYELDTASLFLIYSFDSFENQIDSLRLLPGESVNYYTAELTPEIETTKIHYYIQAGDTMNRIFTVPTEAPSDLYSISIGPDTEKPEINHLPIPFFMLTGENLPISVNADDNLGIDTVFVEYSVNGQPQTPFGLTLDSLTTYTGIFNFDIEQLKDGDEITYNVTAKDSSFAQNTKKIPFKDKFTFKVEEIFDPIGGYINNFNNPTIDFIISDFDIYTETSFEDGALQSPHPYPSPDNNNVTWDFSTILKYPIILKENGTMSFDEVVLVEPGEYRSVFGDDDFWDYVIIEGSKDFGKTWLQISTGYDSGDNSSWETNYNENIVGNNSETIGSPDMFNNREISLLENENFVAGDTILVRFRLFSDPFAHGWGWTIDNLRIQSPVSVPQHLLSPGNILVFPNPFNGLVNIEVQAKNRIAEVEIVLYNINGDKIYSSLNKNVFGKLAQIIDLTGYSNGMYFLSVKENGIQMYSKKIVKN